MLNIDDEIVTDSATYEAAVHEAGHAATMIYYGVPFDSVEVYTDPVTMDDGSVIQGRLVPRGQEAATSVAAFDILMSGVIAEMMFCEKEVLDTGYMGDVRMTRPYLEKWGIVRDDSEYKRMIARLAQIIHTLLGDIAIISMYLVKYKRLTYDDVIAALATHRAEIEGATL